LVENDSTWLLRNTIKAPKPQHFAYLERKEIPASLATIERTPVEYVIQIAVKLLWLSVLRLSARQQNTDTLCHPRAGGNPGLGPWREAAPV
jgi:hypothetical protein